MTNDRGAKYRFFRAMFEKYTPEQMLEWAKKEWPGLDDAFACLSGKPIVSGEHLPAEEEERASWREAQLLAHVSARMSTMVRQEPGQGAACSREQEAEGHPAYAAAA